MRIVRRISDDTLSTTEIFGVCWDKLVMLQVEVFWVVTLAVPEMLVS